MFKTYFSGLFWEVVGMPPSECCHDNFLLKSKFYAASDKEYRNYKLIGH